MLHPIRISSRGRIFNAMDGQRRILKYAKYGVRPSLPYQGIARRALNAAQITYDKDIDISAFIK